MIKKMKKCLLVFGVIIILLSSVLLVLKNTCLKKVDRFNISYLSDEFIEDYFEEISNIDSNEEKENMLIVISDSKIVDSYGAKSVIEAPNHQYILQFDSEKEKQLALEKIKNDKRIESVEENGVYTIEEGNYNSWGIEKMALEHAIISANSNSKNLQQVTVAVIDTGCDMSLFSKYYQGKIAEFYNVLDDSTTVMNDENGHGTHVAGTIAEGTPDNVKILPIKVSSTGSMYYSDIIAAINYIVYNNNAQVINMSFGGYGYNEALNQAIESAKKKNIISVAAAGNNNTSKKHYPSAFESTISIASVDSDLNKSAFSNYGAEITFVAPGTNIKSIMGKDTDISKRNENNDDDDHEIISGTSMATPHAAAAVAILKGYNKDLTFENVVGILKDNAQDLGEKGWDKYYGNGLISFKGVEFCDGTYCDELGVYKDLNKSILSIEATNLSLTQYNYYSVTNLLGSKVTVNYIDNTSEEIAIGKLPNVEILNYDPTASGSQEVIIKVGSLTTSIQVDNPISYISGWEYSTLADGKLEITGYKNHGLEIERLYIPETIDSKQVVAFADNFKLSELGADINCYTYLYLPKSFTRIGDYSLSGTNIKYIYGADTKIEVGAHAFENSEIVLIDIPIIKIEDYAFKDCYELTSIKVWEEQYASNYGTALKIGDYAFYNCKKLATIEMTNEQGYNLIGDIGDYAFYNCILLSYFDLRPARDIGDYAFYNTFLLTDIDLYQANSIGEHGFHGSGISELSLSVSLETLNESSFEDCKNLKDVSVIGGRIEKRAFWNAGVETIYISNMVEYIAEDAFAYTPMKSVSGSNPGTGNYKSEHGAGVIELATNKLIIGVTDEFGASNTSIPSYVTEIGNYAFTGNNNLNKITIPSTIIKIGTHAFEDCYQLSDVYMLGSTIEFENDTFKRTSEGEIQGADLNLYVYKESAIKQEVIDKGLNYRHIEPDEILVTNYEDTYKAKTEVNFQTLGVKLIYHEEEDREEVLNTLNYGTYAPISNGVGFKVSYQTENSYNFQYGDEYFVVEAKNALGYLVTKNVYVIVEKAIPKYTVPTGLTADFGQQLLEIALPDHFEWMDGSQIITESGEVVYKAKYVPEDTKNYEIVENIDITITVNKKIYTVYFDSNGGIFTDDKTTIVVDEWNDTKLNTLERPIREGYEFKGFFTEKEGGTSLENYIAESGIDKDGLVFYAQWEKVKHILSFDANGGIGNMDNQIFIYGDVLKISKNVFTKEGYSFKGWNTKVDGTGDSYIDEQEISITNNLTLYAMWEESYSYVINKYTVDEDNKYIDLIDVGTTIDEFKNNIDLNDGYTVDVEYKSDTGENLVYTGGKTRIYKDGELYAEYTNIIRGDVNGNAVIDIIDYIRIMKHIMEEIVLEGEFFKAADVTRENGVDIIDYIRIMKMIMEEN